MNEVCMNFKHREYRGLICLEEPVRYFSGLAGDIMICRSHYGSRLQNGRFFFLKISKEIDKAFQTFCLTARAYLNTQKYGLFCSLLWLLYRVPLCRDPT